MNDLKKRIEEALKDLDTRKMDIAILTKFIKTLETNQDIKFITADGFNLSTTCNQSLNIRIKEAIETELIHILAQINMPDKVIPNVIIGYLYEERGKLCEWTDVANNPIPSFYVYNRTLERENGPGYVKIKAEFVIDESKLKSQVCNGCY